MSDPFRSPLRSDIFVPPEQVMDTVNIYIIPGQRRKLSLRFLAWFLLKKDIQTHTHDSIEDARYALLLYKLYQQFEEEGRFEDVMEDIFFEGQKVVSSIMPCTNWLIGHRDSNPHKIGRLRLRRSRGRELWLHLLLECRRVLISNLRSNGQTVNPLHLCSITHGEIDSEAHCMQKCILIGVQAKGGP